MTDNIFAALGTVPAVPASPTVLQLLSFLILAGDHQLSYITPSRRCGLVIYKIKERPCGGHSCHIFETTRQ